MKTAVSHITLPHLLFATGLLLIAAKPVGWLLQTWRDAAYASAGFWAFLLTMGLLFWSISSPRMSHTTRYRLPMGLLVATALVRLVGQWLAIDTLGALALVVDVYALGLLLGTAQRQRPVSAVWLALLFVFALPVERILQRGLGFALQDLSAKAVCRTLNLVTQEAVCHGTRIAVDGQQFLIDLPCSGSNGLVLLAMLTTTLMAIVRPTLGWGGLALLLVPLAGLLTNTLRILLLVFGSVLPLQATVGIDVMAQPWHDLSGVVALLPVSWLLLHYFGFVSGRTRTALAVSAVSNTTVGSIKPLVTASLFAGLALLIILLPPQPLDISKPVAVPALPAMIAGAYAQPVELLPKEQAYFTQYGGSASKAFYGNRQLLLTKTTSPLRHLHAPDECLRGLGFTVQYLGSIDEPVASAVYRATDLTGRHWKVAVSFIADDGFTTSNVSAAVWHWLQHPTSQWLGIQRIAPWETTFQSDRAWDQVVLAIFDLPLKPLTITGNAL